MRSTVRGLGSGLLLGGVGLLLSCLSSHAQTQSSMGASTGITSPVQIRGSTGCNTIGTSILKGNGSGGCANAVPGTDYAAPTSGTSILKGNGAGGFANAVSGTDYAPATSGSALLKGNGAGGFANAVSGTDYAPATSGSALLKGNGAGGFANAVSGTDYAPATSGSALLKGNGAGGFANAAPDVDYVPPVDVNNNITLQALDAQNDGNLIEEIGTDAQNQVHIGGGAASGISLDNNAAVNQGTFSSGAYLDVPAINPSFTGGTENCAQKWHIYTLAANATITLSCPTTGTINQTLDYLFYQPNSGSTYTYSFVAGNGATLMGDTPVACNVNGCVDKVEVTWVASQNDYIVNLVKSNITGVASCPAGQTCYYVSSSTGSDSNAGTSPTAPWQTLSKANSILSSLHPGDELLFKSGDTWTASASNPEFKFGDTAAHAAVGTSSKPILISTYGGSARAVFDMGNINSACFSDRHGSYGFKYVTLSNFECKHAFAQGVSFLASGGQFPGITVQNFYIHNVGPGCSTSNAACVGNATELPPDWASGGAHTSTGSNNLIYPLSNNAGAYWFIETAASCTSGSTYPTFPQSVGATVSDGSCVWQNTGLQGGYKNALDFEDTGVGADGVHFLNNIVKWMGGHNCVQVHYDTGAVLVQGNTVGPGCVHGGIDVKGVGNSTASPAIVAQILSNTASCGYNENLCGCQNGGNCASNQTPAFYTHNEVTTAAEDIIYQENVAYDSGVGFQLIANAGVSPTGATRCYNSTSNVCPIQARYYNNTVYLPTGISNSYGFYVACGGNGTEAPCTASTIDIRNNIYDGAGSDSVYVPAGYGSEIEDYNDIGGSQGSPGFSFNGSTTRGSHDLYCATNCAGSSADPLYVAPAATPPNFSLQPGSPCINRGLAGLTTGNTDIGAF